MGFFDKMNQPVFLKEDSDAREYLQKLENLRQEAPANIINKLDREIKLVSIGLVGEDNIAFELKNSGIPMYVLRDVHFEHNDLTAQIDYIVITRKMKFFIECKNLIGNIDIDNGGNFIRNYTINGKKIKEGIYSPITQNQRHLDIYKQLVLNGAGSIRRAVVEKIFGNVNKSIVVLANPKTILNDRYAPKDIKKKVIRADQLIKYIRDEYNASKEVESNDKSFLETAQVILGRHTPKNSDYIKKFQDLIKESNEVANATSVNETVNIKKPQISKTSKNKDDLVADLKAFRLTKCREEGIKPFFIFNDKQMMDLIEKMPANKTELQNVQGFGEVKVQKYGEEILGILR